MKRVLACTILLVSASLPSNSSADDSVEITVNDARVRFRRGVEFYMAGSYDASLAELTKAYEIAPNYRVLYNLAQVQTQRHDYVAAIKLFDEYLKQGGSKIVADRRAQVETSLAELKSLVASLSVVSSAGAEVSIDGTPAGILPLNAPMLMNPGVYKLQLRKIGYETLTHEVTIASAETVRVALPMRALPAAASAVPREPVVPRSGAQVYALAPAPPPAQADEGSRAPLWVSLIATSALTGGSIAFGLLAKGADDDLDRALTRVPANRNEIAVLRERVERNAALCDGLGAGVVVGALFSLYFALSGSGEEESERALAPRVVASGRGVELMQRF